MSSFSRGELTGNVRMRWTWKAAGKGASSPELTPAHASKDHLHADPGSAPKHRHSLEYFLFWIIPFHLHLFYRYVYISTDTAIAHELAHAICKHSLGWRELANVGLTPAHGAQRELAQELARLTTRHTTTQLHPTPSLIPDQANSEMQHGDPRKKKNISTLQTAVSLSALTLTHIPVNNWILIPWQIYALTQYQHV